jgi:hypothetical protein
VSDHKFRVAVVGVGGVFKIMQLLPAEGGNYQYRIKSADEPHDRVVKESELDRAM